MKLRIAAVALLLSLPLAACGSDSKSSNSSSTATTAAGAPAGETVAISLEDYKILPAAVTVKAGTVAFAVKNAGQAVHDYHIRQNGKELATTKELKPGESQTVNATLAAGEYNAYCHEAGHESLGMTHTITVS